MKLNRLCIVSVIGLTVLTPSSGTADSNTDELNWFDRTAATLSGTTVAGTIIEIDSEFNFYLSSEPTNWVGDPGVLSFQLTLPDTENDLYPSLLIMLFKGRDVVCAVDLDEDPALASICYVRVVGHRSDPLAEYEYTHLEALRQARCYGVGSDVSSASWPNECNSY